MSSRLALLVVFSPCLARAEPEYLVTRFDRKEPASVIADKACALPRLVSVDSEERVIRVTVVRDDEERARFGGGRAGDRDHRQHRRAECDVGDHRAWARTVFRLHVVLRELAVRLRTPEMVLVERSYAWQLLLLDTVMLATGPLVPLSASLFLFGAPAVHLAHNRPGIAAASHGLRFGMLTVGGGVGAAIGLGAGAATCSSSGGSSCSGAPIGALVGLAIGGGIGMFTAIILDAALFAQERFYAPKYTALRPWFDGRMLGLEGSF